MEGGKSQGPHDVQGVTGGPDLLPPKMSGELRLNSSNSTGRFRPTATFTPWRELLLSCVKGPLGTLHSVSIGPIPDWVETQP